MTTLSDTQTLILSAASQREDRNVLPLPGSLRGGAAGKVVGALLARGLIAETVTGSRTQADASLNRIWRNDADGRAILLHVTEAGMAAIGVETEAPEKAAGPAVREPDNAPTCADEAKSAKPRQDAPTAPDPAPKARTPRTPREGTKQAQLIEMLRGDGATLDEIAAATGWQAHTVRGAISGALKKRLGPTVTSEKVEGRGRVYTLTD